MSNSDGLIWQANPSWRGMTGWYVKYLGVALLVAGVAYLLQMAGAISFLLFIAVSLVAIALVIGIGYLTRHTTVYTITRERVIEKSGIVNTKTEQAPIEKITNIVIERRLSERILGIGRMNIDTANDSTDDILNWWGIEAPYEVERLINRLRDDAAERRTERRRANRQAASGEREPAAESPLDDLDRLLAE